MYQLNVFDFILTPLYLAIIYVFARGVVQKRIENEPYYKYYVAGLFAKIFGGLGVCLIYMYYYNGGDTIVYFHDAKLIASLSYSNPGNLVTILYKPTLSLVEWHFMNFNINDQPMMAGDPYAWFVVKCTWIFTLAGLGSFFATVILLNVITFIPVWKLYKIFMREFPSLHREFAFAIFFIPSVAFWGSGLLKDNLTFSAVCLFSHAIYSILIIKKNYLIHFIQIFISYYVLTSLKPYIFFALLPGSFLWMTTIGLGKFNNKLIRSVTAPALLIIAALTGYLALSKMGDKLGGYSVESVMTKAVATQQDLKQDYNLGNSFDIGDFDATAESMLSKAPIAITSALFRPFLWEARNPVMLISAMENFLLLIFSLYILYKVKVIYLFRLLIRHHLLLFSLVFSLFFSFGVGLSTSNFGSMVRYKIPAMPFFLASLIIAREILLKTKTEKKLLEYENADGFATQ